jgi:hypothetical protein
MTVSVLCAVNCQTNQRFKVYGLSAGPNLGPNNRDSDPVASAQPRAVAHVSVALAVFL